MLTISRSEAGFTLVEVLVAAALVVSVIAGLAHLVASGVSRAQSARSAGVALALAQGKLEELRGAIWSYDAVGARISDAALAPSPADALSADRDGWCDAFDAFGQPVPHADVQHAVYRRRWSIEAFDAADADTLNLRVCVRSVVSAAAAGRGMPDACVATILTRKP